MGLDMYLYGEAVFYGLSAEELKTHPEQQAYRLGYWRKHPDLHGYIVKEFAGGVDDCRDIYLSEIEMRQIIDAIKTDALPVTSGFFFGESSNDDEEKAEAIDIFQNAIAWLNNADDGTRRYVFYQASW